MRVSSPWGGLLPLSAAITKVVEPDRIRPSGHRSITVRLGFESSFYACFDVVLPQRPRGDMSIARVAWDNRCTMHSATPFERYRYKPNIRRATLNEYGPRVSSIELVRAFR